MIRRHSLNSKLETLVQEFESDCASDVVPSIDDFLSRVPEPAASKLLLQQLVKIELQHAFRSNRTIDCQTYVKYGETIVGFAQEQVKAFLSDTFLLPGHTITAELGRGAMGTVYAATRDADGRAVAIKTLQQADPTLLLRIKKEFRSLQGLPAHPNVIDLFQLFVFESTAAFTMEIVDGCKLSELLERKACSEEVFVDIFRQIALGVLHLHSHGLLHRDLKPDNVLITPDLRAVILDFGLVSELRGGSTNQTLDYRLKGSLPFMSPEQAGGADLTPASDWYSFGVMIHLYLFGSYPHEGESILELLEQKRQPFVPTANDFSGSKKKLLELAESMLSSSPTGRPSGNSIVETLTQESLSKSAVPAAQSDSVFAGRSKELAELFEFVRNTKLPGLVEVAGRSGYGKSDFLAEFQKRVSANCGLALFATGKCYAQENVPYPGFDELVDHLAIQLNQLDESTVRAMLPLHLNSLVEMFPVLATVDTIAKQIAKQHGKQPMAHSREVKDQAIRSFIVLLARISDVSRLILVIDDCQWANNETLNLIREIFSSEHLPQVILVIAYREGEMDSIEGEVENGSFKSIPIGPLGVEDCRELFSRGPFEIKEYDTDRLQALCQQTAGSPLHLCEVAEHLSNNETVIENFSYKELIQQRIKRLPAADVRFLKILSCSEFPIHRKFLDELLGNDTQKQAKKLETARLVVHRTQQKTLELHHAQIGAAILELLSETEKRDIHHQLANCLEGSLESRLEQQIEQLSSAERMEAAAELMSLAAERSINVLAYEEAISLLEQSVSLRKEHYIRSGIEEVEKRLADVYGLAGYAKQSARIYQELLLKEKNPLLRFQYAKKAAYNLMTSGRVDEGTEFLKIAAHHGKVSLTSSKPRCLLGILYHRVAYLIGKKGPVKQDRRDYEVAVVLADGIFLMNPLRSAYFQSRAVWLSLRSGTEKEYFQSRCEDILNLSVENDVWRKRATRMLDQLKEDAESSSDPSLWADYQKALSNHYFFAQRFDKVLALNDASLQYYLEHSPGAVWHITALWSIRFWTMNLCGDFKLMRQQLRIPIRRARAQGDLNTVRSLAEAQCVTQLVSDNLEVARSELAIIREKLPSNCGYSVSHRNADFAEAAINLYAGNARHVADLLAASARKSRSSETNQIQLIRLYHSHYEVSALCALIDGEATDSNALKKRLQKICRRLKKEKTDFASGLFWTVQGFLAHHDGHPDQALQHVVQALKYYDACGAGAYSNTLRYRGANSTLASDERWGPDCDAYIHRQEIQDMDRFAAIYAPPFR